MKENKIIKKLLITNGITCFCYFYLTVFLFIQIWENGTTNERSLFLILSEISVLISTFFCTSKKNRQFICRHCFVLCFILFICDIISVYLLFVNPYYKALFECFAFQIFGTCVFTFYNEVKEVLITDPNKRNDFMIANEKVNSFFKICGAVLAMFVKIESIQTLAICFFIVAITDFLMTFSVYYDVHKYLKQTGKNFYCFEKQEEVCKKKADRQSETLTEH